MKCGGAAAPPPPPSPSNPLLICPSPCKACCTTLPGHWLSDLLISIIGEDGLLLTLLLGVAGRQHPRAGHSAMALRRSDLTAPESDGVTLLHNLSEAEGALLYPIPFHFTRPTSPRPAAPHPTPPRPWLTDLMMAVRRTYRNRRRRFAITRGIRLNGQGNNISEAKMQGRAPDHGVQDEMERIGKHGGGQERGRPGSRN